MTTDPKIYTAAEVASAGISKEEIDQALATITQKAYKAAENGKSRVILYGTNESLLNKIARRLGELGYTTELFEQAAHDSYIIVQWDTD